MSTWFTSMFSSSTTPGDKITSSALNVTKIVSLTAALFAGLTTALQKIDTIHLTDGQMVTIWLTIAALITILGATDMVIRGYVTAKTAVHEQAVDPPIKVLVDDSKGGQGHTGELTSLFIDSGVAMGFVTLDSDKKSHWVPLASVHHN